MCHIHPYYCVINYYIYFTMFSVFNRSSALRKVVCRLFQGSVVLNNTNKLKMGSSYSRSYSPNDLQCQSGGVAGGIRTLRAEQNSGTIEGVLCHKDDLADNEKKVFDLGDDGKVLLVKQQGQIYALGTKCTHYGAPLVNGALGDGRIRCPWHGACFDLKTGDIEDFPGFDSLPCHKVIISDKGLVKVQAKLSDLQTQTRMKDVQSTLPCNAGTCEGNVVVIIGGGPSGATCAETLRAEGFQGEITIVAKEAYLPYDRPKVSKMTQIIEVEKLQARTKDYYKDAKITIINGVSATKVDTFNKIVTLDNEETLPYMSLYLATGSKPKMPAVPGLDQMLSNVYTVRNYEDSVNIMKALGDKKDKHVVVLGLGFIGLEMSAACVEKAKSVTIIGHHTSPLGHVFGDEIGNRLRKFCEEKGIEFHVSTTVVKCHGEDGILKVVELANKKKIPVGVLILGIGTTYNTEFLSDSGIPLQEDGAIEVNEFLETEVSHVYAGGDIAYAPVFMAGNQKANIGHIGLSQYHGRIAALNIMKKKNTLRTVPFFWTQVFGKSIRYAGYGKASSTQIVGDLEAMQFVVYFFDNSDKVIAVASCNHDPIVSQFAEYVYQGKSIIKKDLTENPFGWVSRLN